MSSIPRLLAVTLFDLALALLIAAGGAVLYAYLMRPYSEPELVLLRGLDQLGVPLDPIGRADRYEQLALRWAYQVQMTCTDAPADDTVLADWFRTQSDVTRVRTERHPRQDDPRGRQRVVVKYDGPKGLARPDVPWEKLGYKPEPPPDAPWWVRTDPELGYVPTTGQTKLITIGLLQVGFAVVGFWRMWRNRKLTEPWSPAWEGRPLFVGLVAGAVAGALYWAADQAVLAGWGPPTATGRSWQALPSVGWHAGSVRDVWTGVDPHPVLLLTLAGVVGGFPLAQTAFFFGGLDRVWSDGGRPVLGTVILAPVAAALLLDWFFFPAILALAVLLTVAHRAGRSVMAPLVALVVVNLVVVGVTFGVLPSRPHAVNQLPGRWEAVGRAQAEDLLPGRRSDTSVRFLRGGAMDGGRRGTKADGVWTVHWPKRYEWLDAERVRVLGEKTIWDEAATTMTQELEAVTYRVALDGSILTLTREADGEVFKYRRDE